MKCNNCGVNYDDEERECPMCGTRAGAGKSRFMPHYTDYGHTDHTDGSCTHRTFTQKYTSKPPARTQPTGAQPKKGSSKSSWVTIVAIVLTLLLSFLPNLLQNARHALEGVSWGLQSSAPEPALPADTDDDVYDYEANRMAPIEVLGEYQAVDTGLGDFILMLDDEDNYTFAFEGNGWRYDEMGWAWCVYNDPEEQMYQDIYTPDQYDSYTLCLDLEQAGDADGTQPEAIAAHIEQGEMWMLVYVSQADGSIVLDDAYGDAAMFFGGNQFLPLQAIQKG